MPLRSTSRGRVWAIAGPATAASTTATATIAAASAARRRSEADRRRDTRTPLASAALRSAARRHAIARHASHASEITSAAAPHSVSRGAGTTRGPSCSGEDTTVRPNSSPYAVIAYAAATAALPEIVRRRPSSTVASGPHRNTITAGTSRLR